MEKVIGENPRRQALPLFGGYRLLRALKRGPFLESHLVQAEAPPHNLFVLKRLHPLVVHRADWVARFLEEARRAALLWHPNIVRIYDLGSVEGIPYFTQPFLFGKKLQTLLARSRSLPIPTGMALLIVRQIVEAFEVAHRSAGGPLCHGGLHPERIFTGYDGIVYVGDFGLGWLEDPRSAVRSRYRAPESVLEKRDESRGTVGEDLYAAAAILCELLGEYPEPVKPSMSPWGYLPGAVRSVVTRGLAAEPAERFQSAAEMRSALEAILQSDYPRLNLANYIQAFFGKEIEAESKTFGRTPSVQTASHEPSAFQWVEPPPVILIPPASLQAEASHPASVEVLSLPLTASPPPEPEAESAVAPASSETPAEAPPAPLIEKEAPSSKQAPRSWQPVWWSLFGLLLAVFLGVLFFSLYHRPGGMENGSPAPPSPQAQPADLPPVEEKREPAPPPSPVEEPQLSHPPAPSASPVPASPATMDESLKEPPLPPAKPRPPRIKPTAEIPTEKIPPPTPAAILEPLSPRPIEKVPSKPKTNEELVRELIERQRQAYQSQDWSRHRDDLAEGKGELERRMAELFEGARPLAVDFEIYELRIRGEEADISLMQTARLKKGEAVSLQKTLLFWKLKREKERWRIEKFNVIEKYPPTEVG